MRRVIKKNGYAIFLYRNPKHLVLRIGRVLGVNTPLMLQRKPTLSEFAGQLNYAGFLVDRTISGGVTVPRGVVRPFTRAMVNHLSAIRMPSSYAVWNILICKPAD